MDLFLSSQSMLVLVAVALASMAVAWFQQQARARRRAAETPPPALERVEQLPVGQPATVVGVLRVQGAMCSRFEDAHTVAATSYRQPPRRGSEHREVRIWHARAERLYLDLDGARVELDGPLLVARGSDEWTVDAGLDRLRERVRDRVYAAEVVARARERGETREHVFRSLEPGDTVAVSGIAERKVDADGPASYRHHGGGWRLVPDDGGVLVARYRGRPSLRGQLGRVPLYAAALGAASAALFASFVAGMQPTCSDHRELCALYGLCGTRLVPDGAALSVACVAPSSADCEKSLRCRKLGGCTATEWGECIAASDADCRSSLSCDLYGRCSASSEGECVAASEADCMHADRCRAARNGCTLQGGMCVPQDQVGPVGQGPPAQ